MEDTRDWLCMEVFKPSPEGDMMERGSMKTARREFGAVPSVVDGNGYESSR